MKIQKKNKYDSYLKKALVLEKEGNFDFAAALYKECLKIKPDDEYLKGKISSFDKIKDCSVCICSKPEFCLRYKTDMSSGLLDHNWCKNASEQEREIFLSHKNVFHKHTSLPDGQCIFANAHKNLKPKSFDIKEEVDLSRLKIFCLGHSDKQFETIQKRDYLEITNLNKLDAGKYSGNEWSESRAFLAYEDLISNDIDFVGFVTASWNKKYTKPIHDFHKWNGAKILLNSKPEDKIFLCADILCTCQWTQQNNILGTIYRNDTKQITKSFLKIAKIYTRYHRYSPCSNQMISHKENIKEYIDFLTSNDIFGKVDWYVNKIGNDNFTDVFANCQYNKTRLKGYFMELVSFFWFSKQDYTYIPTVKKFENWYSVEEITKRGKEWK